MKIIRAVLLSFGIVGCTSTGSNLNYYLLDTPDVHKKIKPQVAQINMIVLEPVQLADYLKKINLVINIRHNQLYYSEQDVWAESLQTGIYKALLSKVNGQTAQVQLISIATPGAKQISKRLIVKFDHFMPTDQSKVIATGQFWLTDSDTPSNSILGQNFNFQLELHQDGYAHATEQLNALLDKLSQDIVEQLEPNKE